MPGLTMPAFGGASLLAPLVLRVVTGVVMAAHGYNKLASGPSNFAETLTGLGVPAPGFMRGLSPWSSWPAASCSSSGC
jgi:uncharacterized membrane protein YphA (DoxX/SURF4 family)